MKERTETSVLWSPNMPYPVLAMMSIAFVMIDIVAYLLLHYPMRFSRNLAHPINQRATDTQKWCFKVEDYMMLSVIKS